MTYMDEIAKALSTIEEFREDLNSDEKWRKLFGEDEIKKISEMWRKIINPWKGIYVRFYGTDALDEVADKIMELHSYSEALKIKYEEINGQDDFYRKLNGFTENLLLMYDRIMRGDGLTKIIEDMVDTFDTNLYRALMANHLHRDILLESITPENFEKIINFLERQGYPALSDLMVGLAERREFRDKVHNYLQKKSEWMLNTYRKMNPEMKRDLRPLMDEFRKVLSEGWILKPEQVITTIDRVGDPLTLAFNLYLLKLDGRLVRSGDPTVNALSEAFYSIHRKVRSMYTTNGENNALDICTEIYKELSKGREPNIEKLLEAYPYYRGGSGDIADIRGTLNGMYKDLNMKPRKRWVRSVLKLVAAAMIGLSLIGTCSYTYNRLDNKSEIVEKIHHMERAVVNKMGHLKKEIKKIAQ